MDWNLLSNLEMYRIAVNLIIEAFLEKALPEEMLVAIAESMQ